MKKEEFIDEELVNSISYFLRHPEELELPEEDIEK